MMEESHSGSFPTEFSPESVAQFEEFASSNDISCLRIRMSLFNHIATFANSDYIPAPLINTFVFTKH
jgi:hypothetical protein